MSQTLDQIYIANPSTTMLSTDLLYLVHSPYTSGTDSAITYANLAAAIGVSDVHSIIGTANQVIVSNPTGNVTLSLPQSLGPTSSPTFNALSVTTSTVTGNAIANNFAPATSIIVLIGGTSTFTNATSQIVVLGGSGGTIILPNATTLTVGWQYFIHNNSSGNVTIETNGGATLTVMASGAYINLTNVTITAPAGTWAFSFDLPQNVLWGTSLLSATSTAASFSSLALGTALPVTSGGTGVASVTTIPTASAFAGWDANSNLSANSFLSGSTTTAIVSAATTTLTTASTYQQIFTSTTNISQTVVLPVASTLVVGQSFNIINNGTGGILSNLIIQSSGANTIITMPPQTNIVFTCILASGTTAASWVYEQTVFNNSIVPAIQPVSSTGTLFIGSGGQTPLISFGGANNPSAVQIAGIGNGGGNIVLATLSTSFAASTTPRFDTIKSRSAVQGSFVATQSGDNVFALNIFADNGSSYSGKAAAILVNCTSALTSTGIPSSILFQTNGTGANLVTGMTLDNNQVLTLANALPVTSGGTGLTSLSTFATSGANTNITAMTGLTGALSTPTSISSAPAASQSSSLALGTAYLNPFGYDVVLTVYVAVTSATSASILCGVGPTITPTQQTIISGLTLAALSVIPITVYLPAGYYALISNSGTITDSIAGQQAMPV